MECGGCEVVLLPRGGHSVVERGRRGGADVLVGFGEGCRIHGGVARSTRTCSARRGVVVNSRYARGHRDCLHDGEDKGQTTPCTSATRDPDAIREQT
jgi:hypothetical protein